MVITLSIKLARERIGSLNLKLYLTQEFNRYPTLAHISIVTLELWVLMVKCTFGEILTKVN